MIFMAVLKLLHVLFIFVWIGSLLTLTRLLAKLAKESDLVQERVIKILRRFYLLVDLPSMALAVVFGLCLLFLKDTNWKAPWLHMKLTFAFLLIVCDLICGRQIAKHSRTMIPGRGVSYQILHGVAGLLFIGVLVAIYVFKQCSC